LLVDQAAERIQMTPRARDAPTTKPTHRTSSNASETLYHGRVRRRMRRATLALLTCAIFASLALTSAASPSGARIRAHASSFLTNLRLVDYFPSARGWASMWSEWSASQTSTDFARVAALDGNCVRVIVNAPAFGFPHPSPVMLQRLARTIAIAKAHGLRVELTLFDGWSEYQAIEQSEAWLGTLLESIQDKQQIAYIDLHNELPADTNPSALAWAQEMVPFTRSTDGGVPVTVSTSISSGTAPLAALVHALAASPPNLYDVHYYGNAADTYATLAQARGIVGDVPLFVGETGFATSPSYGWARGLQPDARSLESYQDYYFRMVEYASHRLGLPDAAPWILYDMPGQGSTQWGYHMGILHANGSPKPAAATLARVFAGDRLGTSFNNGFEQGTGRPAAPTIWRKWLPGDARFSLDRHVAHSGAVSALIAHAGGSHLTGCPAYSVAPITAVLPYESYTLRAWARGRRITGKSRAVIVWTDSAGRFISSTSSAPLPPGNSAWKRLSVTSRPPDGASAVEVDLQSCEDSGKAWFDDVSFSTGS
jgi:Cellulase (glycosyl hydrolase family 5)